MDIVERATTVPTVTTTSASTAITGPAGSFKPSRVIANAATTIGSRVGGGAILGSVGAYGAIYLDPVEFPDLFRPDRQAADQGARHHQPGCPSRQLQLWPVPGFGVGQRRERDRRSVGAILDSAAINAPAAAGAAVATGAAFAFPTTGWYVLGFTTVGTSAAGSSTHVKARLERLYA